MSKKGENIYKRKDDRWEARYERGREYDGRVLYGYCYGRTYKEAREKQRAAEKGLARAKASYGAGFSRYCREWLEVRRVAIKESSVQKYEGEIERYISPNLGGLDPTFITAADMAEMARRLLGGGLSPKSVNDVLTLTYTILKYARRRLGITAPPEKFERVSEHKRETRVLCGEEQQRLLCELDEGQNREKFGILLAIKTGMRIGELCALRQRDVAVGEGVIYVRSTMQRVKNRDGGAKTKITITQPTNSYSFKKSAIINGAGHTVRASNETGKYDSGMEGRVFDFNAVSGITVKIYNMFIRGENVGVRGLSLYSTENVTLVLDNCAIWANYYAINVASANTGLKVTVRNGTISEGWCAIQSWSPNAVFTIENSVLKGINNKSYTATGDNDFSTIVVNGPATNNVWTITNCKIEASQTTGNKQWLFLFRASETTTVNLNNCECYLDGEKLDSDFESLYADGNGVAFTSMDAIQGLKFYINGEIAFDGSAE